MKKSLFGIQALFFQSSFNVDNLRQRQKMVWLDFQCSLQKCYIFWMTPECVCFTAVRTVWFVPQPNIRGAKKHEVIPIKACQRNVYLQNEVGQGKNSRAGEKHLNSNIKMWFHAYAPFFRETKTFICSSVFVPVGEALIILNRGNEHNRTDSVSQWLRAMKAIEDEIPVAVIQRYWVTVR